MAYAFEPLDLNTLLTPLCEASATLARLDERLAHCSVAQGWIERQHYADACAALMLEGELVHLEDLVLHDAHMDIRMPSHALTRAYGVLRARRHIFSHKPDWALKAQGLSQLMARRGQGLSAAVEPNAQAIPQNQNQNQDQNQDQDQDRYEQALDFPMIDEDGPDALTKAIMRVDMVLAASTKLLDRQTAAQTLANTDDGSYIRSNAQGAPNKGHHGREFVYDETWNEAARLAHWQAVVAQTEGLPVLLRAAILADAWTQIDVVQHGAGLGLLVVAALLRSQGLAAHHLACLNLCARQVPRERRRARQQTTRLLGFIEGVSQGALLGMKELDRLMLAKEQMERRVGSRRKHSKIPDLIALVLRRPLITAPLVQQALKLSSQGALNLIADLGLREVTGRGRYRAWTVG